MGALAVAVLSGCQSGPSERDLRASLIAQVREDDERYNQRMDRYNPPKWEVDGSSCSQMRSRVKIAIKSGQIKIVKTGGQTTTYDAEVPHIIESYIKSGQTEDECLQAPERQLTPQQVTYKYEYEIVTEKWHRAQTGGIGDMFGIGQ